MRERKRERWGREREGEREREREREREDLNVGGFSAHSGPAAARPIKGLLPNGSLCGAPSKKQPSSAHSVPG